MSKQKTARKYPPEVRQRSVRMVRDHVGKHASKWAAIASTTTKIGCTPQTLHN
jgi:transposase